MSLSNLFANLAHDLHSEEFRHMARHPAHPSAFTRQRKLPLLSLIAVMLSGMCKSVQAELDQFFGHLQQPAQLVPSRLSPRSGPSSRLARCRRSTIT
jgi:hypothetical protein